MSYEKCFLTVSVASKILR